MNRRSSTRLQRRSARLSNLMGLTASLMAAVTPAMAAVMPSTGSEVTVRGGDHPGFGRVVFDMPAGASVETVTEGSRLLLVFSGADRLGTLPAMPRNVVALKADGATATLALQPGAKARTVRLGTRLVVDVVDAGQQPPEATTSPARAAAIPAGDNAAANAAMAPARSGRAGRPASQRPAAPSIVAPEPAAIAQPEPTVEKQAGETRDAAVPVRPVQSPLATTPPSAADSPPAKQAEPTVRAMSGVAVDTAAPVPVERSNLQAPARPLPEPERPVVIPADTTVGAAAFRRENLAVIVLDRRLTLSPPPGLPGAVVVPGAVSTTVQFPLATGRQLQLARVAAGWSVAVAAASSPGEMQIDAAQDGVSLPMSKQGRAVTIVDPVSGGTLLVGTSLADGVQNAVGVERRGPEYVLSATWLGVAVEPLSDREELRARQGSFLLAGAKPTVPSVAQTAAGRFDFPNEPAPALLNRMNLQLVSAAEAAPRARTVSRLEAAQTMLALGLGVEAEALLSQTASDDPQAAADVKFPALTAMAAVLAGRLDEAAALDDPRLQEVPDVQLWRGLRDRRLGRETAASRDLAAHRDVVSDYPEPLRRLLWPDIAEAAVEAGVTLPAEQLTPYASALLLERHEKFDDAITAWHAVADRPDRLDSVRASRRAIELELATGRIGAGAASDRMEALATAWRGDGRELEFRLRTGELRAAAGNWRAALDLLRATDPLFPDQHEAIRHSKTAVFEAMLAAEGAGLSPMDLVVLASDFADCVPDDGSGAKLAALLADKLMTLDLAARAVPVLQGLVQATTAGPARAEFGYRLAQLLLEGGDDKGAAAALQASAAPNLPAATSHARALLTAKAQAASGDVQGAADGLEKLASSDADDLRATLLAKAGDWRGSSLALSDLAAKEVPAEGPLGPAAQAIVVRQATAAAQASDLSTLHLIQRQLPRMGGAQADLVRVLTETPVTSTRELPRSATELALARNIPQQIQSIGKR